MSVDTCNPSNTGSSGRKIVFQGQSQVKALDFIFREEEEAAKAERCGGRSRVHVVE
jgi:hypothetical protein